VSGQWGWTVRRERYLVSAGSMDLHEKTDGSIIGKTLSTITNVEPIRTISANKKKEKLAFLLNTTLNGNRINDKELYLESNSAQGKTIHRVTIADHGQTLYGQTTQAYIIKNKKGTIKYNWIAIRLTGN